MHPFIICHETEHEVEEARDYILRNADQETVERQYQAYMGPQALTQSHRQTERVRDDFVFLGTFQVFGTPEQVVEQLVALHDAGVDGIHLVFNDWVDDLKFFGERVLPMLRAATGDAE